MALKTKLNQRVADIGSPLFFGVIIETGEQVSLVKWDDKLPRGNTQFVSNEMLICVDCDVATTL
jgi:hypothetical protein